MNNAVPWQDTAQLENLYEWILPRHENQYKSFREYSIYFSGCQLTNRLGVVAISALTVQGGARWC